MSSSQSDVCLSLLHSHMQTVSTYMSEHIHTQTVHTCECAQTQIAYTCCANIQECTHTLTHKYIHTLTLTKLHMLTHTHTTLLNHVNVHCHLWKTNRCVPSLPPPCPATTHARCTYRCCCLQLCCSSITCASIGQSGVQGCVNAAVKQ